MKLKEIIIITTILGTIIGGLLFYDNTEHSPRQVNQVLPKHGSSLESLILSYGAHPFDPDLPNQYYVGASDYVIQNTDPRILADVLNSGLNFAKSRLKNKPIYACSLARIAYYMDDEFYQPIAFNLFQEAAAAGSPVAHYYLTTLVEDDSLAIYHLEESERLGFITIDQNFNEQEDNNESKIADNDFFSAFNYSDLIKASYHKDYSALKQEGLMAKAILLTIHNYLSSELILWYSNPEIHLEVDHEITRKLEAIAASWISKQSFSNSLLSMAHQDAQRLALLYDDDPGLFREIYSGLVQYLKQF